MTEVNYSVFIDFLRMIKENDIRRKAIHEFLIQNEFFENSDDKIHDTPTAILYGFYWTDSLDGNEFWNKTYHKIYDEIHKI
jgi:hypothetical protein